MGTKASQSGHSESGSLSGFFEQCFSLISKVLIAAFLSQTLKKVLHACMHGNISGHGWEC